MTDWHRAGRIESRIAHIIAEQADRGWQFDVDLAHQHIAWLQEEQSKLYNKIRPHLTKEVVNEGPVSRPFRKDGTYTAIIHRWRSDLLDGDRCVGGPFTRVNFVEPDIGSRQKLMAQLLRLGWKPLEYTEKGNPRLTEESLETISSELGRDIALWYVYRDRESQITSQLLPHVREDGRIPAGAIPCGTNTGRMRHTVVVNIPKASKKVIFGRQMRELFTVKPGYKLLGYDAKGLELRFLAHYINDPSYTEVILNGDPHTHHQEMAGLDNRDGAKTFIYAFIYGAGDAKLGSIAGKGREHGKKLRSRFERNIPGLSRLIEQTQREAARGYVDGLDGRRVWLRRDAATGEVKLHTALNVRIQSAGAIYMKTVTCILDSHLTKGGLDAVKVGDFHDEGQLEVHPKDIERTKELIELSFVQANEWLGLNVPMESEIKVGNTWADTH